MGDGIDRGMLHSKKTRNTKVRTIQIRCSAMLEKISFSLFTLLSPVFPHIGIVMLTVLLSPAIVSRYLTFRFDILPDNRVFGSPGVHPFLLKRS